MKRKRPIDFVEFGALRLPISYSPVKALIQDPKIPHVKDTPPALIEKKYDSFVVDARIIGRGRIRGATVDEAKEKALPILREVAMRHASVWQRLREAQSFREDQLSQDVDLLHLETQMPTDLIRLVLKHQCLIVSLDKTFFESSDEGIEAVLPSDSDTPATIIWDQEKLANLADALTLLTPRERVVINHRFGIDGHQFKKLEELAADFGVTRERVRKTVELALCKLREKFATLGDGFHESEVGKTQPLTRKSVPITP